MMKKELVNIKNNGTPYFGIRILMRDSESYNRVVWYLKNTAIRTETNEKSSLKGDMNYIFDEGGKEIARTITSKRIVELTGDVKSEIRSRIEKIIAGY